MISACQVKCRSCDASALKKHLRLAEAGQKTQCKTVTKTIEAALGDHEWGKKGEGHATTGPSSTELGEPSPVDPMRDTAPLRLADLPEHATLRMRDVQVARGGRRRSFYFILS